MPAPRKADLEGQGLYFYLKAREGGYDELGENLAGSTAESVVSFVEGASGLTRSWMSGDPTTGVKADAFALGTMQRSTPVSLLAFYDRASLRLEAYGEERRGRRVSDEELELRELRNENTGIWLELALGHQADFLDPHYAELGRKSAPVTEAIVSTVFSFGVGQIASRGTQALAWASREAAAIGRASKHAATAVRYQARKVFGRQGSVAPNRVNVFRSDADLLKAKLGPARTSHPEEHARIMKHLEDEGVEIVWNEGKNLYYSAQRGGPGGIKLQSDMSIGALRHEYRHFLDHKAAEFPGTMPFMKDWKRFAEFEVRGYQEEIRLARELGHVEFIPQIQKQMGQRIKEIKGKLKPIE